MERLTFCLRASSERNLMYRRWPVAVVTCWCGSSGIILKTYRLDWTRGNRDIEVSLIAVKPEWWSCFDFLEGFSFTAHKSSSSESDPNISSWCLLREYSSDVAGGPVFTATVSHSPLGMWSNFKLLLALSFSLGSMGALSLYSWQRRNKNRY